MSKKPVRQDYVTKVRYLNNLPPPPLNPKFVRFHTTDKKSAPAEADQLLTSLFRKENFQAFMGHVDEQRGMALNLVDVAGVLDGDGAALASARSDVALHPADRALLRDAGIGAISKKEPEVSFLRRTEYISERSVRSPVDAKRAPKAQESYDPEAQLKVVENTFDAAQESMAKFETLKHPRRKHLKPVNAWPLLPDTSMLDSKFMAIKFNGSASIARELAAAKRKPDHDAAAEHLNLQTAIFKPITSADGEWISLYLNQNPDKAQTLHDKLNSTDKEKPIGLLDEVDEYDEFRFKHFKNYDMEFKKFAPNQQELSIKFASAGSKRKMGYYYPISGKIELKKHRASTNTQINKFLRESTYDVIDLKLREPNTNEMRKMDNVRSEYDPMEYEGDEEDDEPETEEPEAEITQNNEDQPDIADEFDNEVENN